LVWARPWRGLVRPALLVGLLPQLLSKAVAHLPLESWLAMYSSMNKQPARPADTAGAQARKTAPAPTAPPPHAPLH
jgi:hypothetical protein